MNALASLRVDALLSYAIAIIIPALDAILPVLPSETAVITLGVATAGSADPRIGLLVACSAAGAFLGDNLCYLLGRRFGPRIERRFFRGEKGAKRLAWAERSLERHGMPLIVVCRFIPGGRTAVTLCCGIVRYQQRRFVIATAIAGRDLGVLLVLHRAPGRPGVRGQAVGRAAARAGRSRRDQHADRAGPAAQVRASPAAAPGTGVRRDTGVRRTCVAARTPVRRQGVTPDMLRPMTPARTRPIETSLRADTVSPRKAMPMTAVPAAPIPVHTA